MSIKVFEKAVTDDKKLSMVTCYDYWSALLLENTNIDAVLVGDSVAMVVHGFESTLYATLAMLKTHASAVARGLKTKSIIVDMPFMSYHKGHQETMEAVEQLMQSGAHALKLEGGSASVCQTIKSIVDAGVPVMGHLGLTPQSIHQLGGYKVQGICDTSAQSLLQDAIDLENAGCFAVVLECVPAALAARITKALSIPTIGIGAGAQTSGQILVLHDLLGFNPLFKPKFLKHFGAGAAFFHDALNGYAQAVEHAEFPLPEHSYQE